VLRNEAEWIGRLLDRMDNNLISPCVNLGASTRDLRQVAQPHISNFILVPLERRGVEIVHSDLKEGDGIDVSGDIYTDEVQSALRAFKPKLILCTNILEHVRNPSQFAAICRSIIANSGYILITVPYSYPYHPDPIDTMYRPTPAEICDLFPDCELVREAVVEDQTYLEWLRQSGSKAALKAFVRLTIPFVRPRGWLSQLHRFAWLFKRYKVSIVLLQHKHSA